MDQLQTELENAAKGLLFMSETDAPFEPVDLGEQGKTALSPDQLLVVLNKTADTSVEVQELPYFLRNMTKIREGASPERLAVAERFQSLQNLLLEQLSEIKVYRIGQRRVEAYILGWTSEGRLLGLKTLSVET